jgi:hypothetical protein
MTYELRLVTLALASVKYKCYIPHDMAQIGRTVQFGFGQPVWVVEKFEDSPIVQQDQLIDENIRFGDVVKIKYK